MQRLDIWQPNSVILYGDSVKEGTQIHRGQEVQHSIYGICKRFLDRLLPACSHHIHELPLKSTCIHLHANADVAHPMRASSSNFEPINESCHCWQLLNVQGALTEVLCKLTPSYQGTCLPYLLPPWKWELIAPMQCLEHHPLPPTYSNRPSSSLKHPCVYRIYCICPCCCSGAKLACWGKEYSFMNHWSAHNLTDQSRWTSSRWEHPVPQDNDFLEKLKLFLLHINVNTWGGWYIICGLGGSAGWPTIISCNMTCLMSSLQYLVI